jgi:hypothetical protein
LIYIYMNPRFHASSDGKTSHPTCDCSITKMDMIFRCHGLSHVLGASPRLFDPVKPPEGKSGVGFPDFANSSTRQHWEASVDTYHHWPLSISRLTPFAIVFPSAHQTVWLLRVVSTIESGVLALTLACLAPTSIHHQLTINLCRQS